MNRFLDLRFVIGLFFLLTGLILQAYSMFDTAAGAINSWCGGLFIVFGLLMVILSGRETQQ